jgi:hypothetical protein
VRTVRFKPLYAAIRTSLDGCSQLQWPYFVAAHMVQLVQRPERDAEGRLVMVTRVH